MKERIIKDNRENADGIDRRGFLKCMAWAGTGLVWAMSGGILKSYSMSQVFDTKTGQVKDGIKLESADFTFAQISDSHIGFDKEANHDVVGTLQAAIGKINTLPGEPSFIIHTGDLSHLSKNSEFDTLDQVLKSARPGQVYFVPGEHDVLGDNGKEYLRRYGKETKGNGWRSFDFHGTHFIGLVNVMDLKPGGMGQLGHEQLEWLEKDVKHLSDSTPLVVFAHVPLWTVYAEWGWGTDDSAQALMNLRRFGSVTVLNGHIHQILQKVEGNITFHTAMSTAFPQPSPGSAPSPGPMKVPDERLRSLLGLTGVSVVRHAHSLAVTDVPLETAGAMQSDTESKAKEQRQEVTGPNVVNISNFTFTPDSLTVEAGTTVTWINRDDIPHTVMSVKKEFSSSVLETDQRFAHAFTRAGVYDYYCSIHPHMTGKIIVK